MAISSIVQQHAIYISSANAIYTFIPKNACTTLRYAATVANLAKYDQISTPHSPKQFEDTMAQVHHYVASPEQITSASYRFIVLRCPWSRLSSVFLDKVVDGKRTGRAIRLNAEEKRYGRPISTGLRTLHRFGILPYIDPSSFTFREFVELISAPAGLDIDHHWMPQSRMALDKYDDVFGMHDLKSAFERITQITDMKIYDTRDLSGHATHRLEFLRDKCYADVSLTELHEMKKAGFVPHHTAFYDNSLKCQVENLYYEDLTYYKSQIGNAGLAFPTG